METKFRNATFARFVAGAMSGATATTLTYPLDLLRARFAAGVETHKKAAIEDLVEIMKTRGVRGLASGLTPDAFRNNAIRRDFVRHV